MPPAVAIRQVTVRAAMGEPAALSAAVRTQLATAAWPEHPRAHIRIRRLRVRGPLARIGSLAAQHVAAALADGSGVEMVRYPDAAALVAALSADLVAGEAARRWWWRQERDLLALPLATALARLWARHAPELLAACRRLAEQRHLVAVIASFDGSAAAEVLDAMARSVGTPATVQVLAALRVPDAVDPVRQMVLLAQARLPVAVAARWQPAAHAARDPVVRCLTVLMALLDGRPLLAAGADAPALVQSMAQMWSMEEGAHPADAQAESAAVDRSEPWRTAARPDTVLPQEVLAQLEETSIAPVQPQALPAASEPIAPPSKPALAVHEPTGDEASPVQQPHWDGDRIATAQVGIWHLVNVVRRRELQPLVSDILAGRGSGWRLLQGLAQGLGLDPADPMAMWLESTATEQEEDAVPAAALTALAQQAGLCYAVDVWNPKLLAASGVVFATATHVDVHLPLNGVRVEVRLAGLDLDPGWVPWLGRVVGFHYHDGGSLP